MTVVAAAATGAAAVSGAACACGTLILVMKHYTALMLQGKSRFKAGSRPPEDISLSLAKTIGKGKQQQFTPREDVPKHIREEEMRWSRIIMNDLENVPLGLVLMWAGQLGGAAGEVHTGLVTAFVASRCVHTWAYANAKQPWRALAWFGGVASNVAMAVNLTAAQVSILM
eukprot:Nk52_evm1s166 gene=Nk52_evmTU1s166